MNGRPPRFARYLVGLLTPRDDREFVLDDLDETFCRIAAEKGAGAARRWVRGQVIRSLPLAFSTLRGSGAGVASQDVRSALRVLRRRPLYALGIAGTLGLGLGSAIVLGGIAWRVWLQPLPLPDAEQLVRVYELGRPDEAGERERGRISPPLLRDLGAEEWTNFVGFGAVAGAAPEWDADGELRNLSGSSVTPGYFELLGMAPVAGSMAFTSRNGSEVPEVVLSESFWRTNFGGDPGVIGTTMDLDGVQHRVLGVVGVEGGYPRAADVFTPLVFEDRQLGEGMRGARYLEGIARVRSESTIEAASAEFAAYVESIGSAHPIHDGWTAEAVSLREDLTGPFRDVLRLLIAAGAAFLLLAVVNVVGLASIRALERTNEVGVRLALGASRLRLTGGAWIEGAVLGAIGGGVALVGAMVLFPRTISWLPSNLARASQVGLSGAGAVGWWLVAIVAGGAVAVVGQRFAPGSVGVQRGTRSTRSANTGRVLVAGQLALTTLLAGVGTVVFERSRALSNHDFGFESGASSPGS